MSNRLDADLDWMDQLAEKHVTVIDHFLSPQDLKQILSGFQLLEQEGAFRQAGIGAQGDHQVNQSIRGDQVYWLDPKNDHAFSVFFENIDRLIQLLNRYGYLGITDAEFHLAKYPVGTFYRKHVDEFKGRSNRVISVVFYLNQNWQPTDGGQLKIYLTQNEMVIEPLAGRLVLFKSDLLPHEVLTSLSDRKSITGWLLKRPVGLGFL
jgi:SM-20-related protein